MSEAKQTAKIIFFVIVLLIAVVIALGLVARFVIKSGFTAGPDKTFGDQHLKTAVALVELHKVRYGNYPQALRDLRFTGDWDALALSSVQYCPNRQQSAYFIEVTRGWVGKPKLDMPAEFWQGTGFDAELETLCKRQDETALTTFEKTFK